MKKFLFVTPFDINKRNKTNAAAANRISLIIRGLELNDKNFEYNLFPLYIEKKSILKLVVLFIKYITLLTTIYKYNYIYIYGEIWFPFLYTISNICNCKIIIERCEYPTSLIINQKISYLQKLKERKFLTSLKHAWMFITCSNKLIKYYEHKINARCHIINIPLLVDVNEFDNIEKSFYTHESYITYCGNMGNNKDGVDILIQAFYEFHKRNKNYKLRLIGGGPKKDIEYLKNLVEQLGLRNSVDFLDYMPRENVIKELKQSSLLTLARPANKQAEGGMPSKLAEYLLTGIPTLVTRVGEIDNYVEDGVNCFLTSPNTYKTFYEKMEYIFQNYIQAQKIAYKGKILAKQFDYKLQTQKIINFL